MARKTIAMLAGLLMGTAACSSLDNIDFQQETYPPGETEISFRQITMQEGQAVSVLALPLDGGKLLDDETILELVPDDPSVLGISRSGYDPYRYDEYAEEDVGDWAFVLTARRAGTTEVRVYCDGDEEATIPATVLAQ